MKEPLGFRGTGFTPVFALLKPTFSLPLRQQLLTHLLQPRAERSPTDISVTILAHSSLNINSVQVTGTLFRNYVQVKLISHSFGRQLSPVHFRRESALPVSYYALFKGWPLLSKPPGCFCTLTSFTT